MHHADLSALAVFAVVAEKRSFRGTARELELSPSAVSHAITALERRLGVRLLARTTRSVALTEAGQKLLATLAPALAEIDQAVGAASEARAAPSGLLRITLPRSSVQSLLLPRLAESCAAYPDIIVELHADDGLVDIVAEGFDAGVRFGESLQQDMVAVRLGPAQRMVALATPDLLRRHPAPRHPRDLLDLPCVGMRFTSGRLYAWEFEKDGEAIEVPPHGPVIFNDNRLVLEATVAGVGFGFVLEDMAAPALVRGEVVRVLEDWCPPFPGFFLYHPSRRQMRPALRAFIDFFTKPRHGP